MGAAGAAKAGRPSPATALFDPCVATSPNLPPAVACEAP